MTGKEIVSMQKVKYLILGAGPAGLTFASMLKRKGEDSFLVLEKEAEAGGLCRSAMVDGSPFDIGGGHFLDVKRPEVNDFLFSFMPRKEWALFERDSRIAMKGKTVGHPLEANIWQFDLEEQVAYLSSIARAGCNSGKEMPESFVEWIRWKLGDKIAEDYMLPYNRKMYAEDLNELGTYWLEKLPDVSFEETLRSCLTHRPYGKEPGHASFYYPKHFGYGEVWLRMAKELAPCVLYHTDVNVLDCEKKQVRTVAGEVFGADVIVTTIPWAEYREIRGMPEELVSSIQLLRHNAIETRYCPENLDTQAQWIYVPDEEIPFHRILVRHNFCLGSRGYWTETRKERKLQGAEALENICMAGSAEGDSFRFLNAYAYPLNTIGKPEIMKKLLTCCSAKGIYGLGRWGEHSHHNSDVVAEHAMALAKRLTN